ncbi:MAG: HD domain-containing protein [Anaerolineales bacterium]|nr:HD domain-containing protein [Anaerolineales bacterium]
MLTVREKLPEFWDLATTIASDLQSQIIVARETLRERIKPLLEPDWVESMDQVIPGWRQIATINDGETALHTLLVCAACFNLPEYTRLAERTRHEIEWAALLHDLDKQLARQDSAHPFRSAAVAARLLPSLGFQPRAQIRAAQIAAWSQLVMAAQRPDRARMVHDHSRLPEIIAGLHACWGPDSSAVRILKAILFHQSLPTLNAWPNAVLLSDAELAYALSRADLQVLGPLMLADSDSWNMFTQHRQPYLQEIRANNAATRRRMRALDAAVLPMPGSGGKEHGRI